MGKISNARTIQVFHLYIIIDVIILEKDKQFLE